MSTEITGPVEFPARINQYGRAESLPERFPVRAGPLTGIVEGGDLRYLRLGPDMVVLRLYAAVRDRNWNTIEPKFLAYELDRHDDHFTLRFAAEHVSADVDFEWTGSIVGTADGVITATIDGRARKHFLKNRIGWCVLHPMELAGVPATTTTPEGVVEGAFPDLISPHQPFIDMLAIEHETGSGGRVSIQFEGDLFEMEDQRNWTDASYKTYSTPLRIPYPVEIKTGDRVAQRVTITAAGDVPSRAEESGPVRVVVDQFGTMPLPPIGLTLSTHGDALAAEDIALLRALQPGHLHVTIDLIDPGWRQDLARASTAASLLGSALEIELIAGGGGADLEEFAAALEQTRVPVARVLVFSAGSVVTDQAVIESARQALATTGVSAQIGGGSRAYFTELNRASLPLADLDVACYTINPQVHAFDNASLTETLAAQAETVRSARAIVGERPIAVGPVTLAPRFNPNATGPVGSTAAEALPDSVDYRQPSLFAAGWLAGSIGSLALAGADAVTYFETTGWKGLIERRDHPLRVSAFHSWPGMVFPAYHVLADVSEFREGEVLPAASTDSLTVQALALRDGKRVRVILANMRDEPAQVQLEIPGAGEARVRRLDTDSVFLAASDPDTFRATSEPLGEAGPVLTLNLGPNGLATVDMELASA